MFPLLPNWKNSSAPKLKLAVIVRRARSFGKHCGCSKSTTKRELPGLQNSIGNSAGVWSRSTAAGMLTPPRHATGSGVNPNSAENPGHELVYSQRRCWIGKLFDAFEARRS